MFLIDTNVVSEIRRQSREALKWMRSVDPEAVHLSVITLGEIARGIVRKQRTDSAAAASLSEWLAGLRAVHGRRILHVTDRVALEWGRISALRTRGEPDGLIAATAIVHDLAIVTRNVRDFEDLPVTIIDPWRSGAR